MSIFDGASQLGTLPSGVVLGIMLGIIWEVIRLERRLRRPAWVIFIGDMLWVMLCGGCMFTLGVGIEGRLRYPVFLGTLIGMGAVRGIVHMLFGKKDRN